MLSRKRFIEGIFAVVLSMTLVLSGCAVKAEWIKVALDDLPTIIQIITSVIGMVGAAQGKGQVDTAMVSQMQVISSQVQADIQLVQKLVNDYQTADAITKPGILNKIDSSLSMVQTNLSALLAAFHVNNAALQTTIASSLGLAITTILAIQSLLPASSSARKTVRPVKPMSSVELKSTFNGIVNSNGYGSFAIN